MVKSWCMEVMRAVQEDLGEVRSTINAYAAPVKGAGGKLKDTISADPDGGKILAMAYCPKAARA